MSHNKKNIRKICVITGTRAEYGLLRNVMVGLRDDPRIDLQIIVTGSHLSSGHGNTVEEIIQDGFTPNEEVDLLMASDSSRATGLSLGLGVIGVTSALSRLKPDLIVLLGDRYEALAAAQSAMMLCIPIAHIHGGEATEGSIDEAVRHSITKMSHIHFPAVDMFRNRILQLGEDPARTFLVGSVGLDNIAALDPVSRADLADFVGMELKNKIFLITYHPVTLNPIETAAIANLIAALEYFPDATIIFTGVNADSSGYEITEKINNFCSMNSHRAASIMSLGYRRYLSLMSISDAVIGNSSSGLLEAPSVGTPTVNIGSRQQGRPRAPSTIDCGISVDEIRMAISKVCSLEVAKIAAIKETPYGQPGASRRIVDVLATVGLTNILLKRFHSIPLHCSGVSETSQSA